MSWMKKRFLELMSIFLIDIEVLPTHKLCETTMQSLERRHSELDIVRNQQVSVVMDIWWKFGYIH